MHPTTWTDRLAGFPRASAELVQGRALSRRTDSKFVLTPPVAIALVEALAGANAYAVLPAGGAPIADYRTIYFDTPSLDLFHHHRRGRRIRHKVRIRHYPDRRITRLEVKSRRTERETAKAWRERRYGDESLTGDDQAFIAQRTGLLAPVSAQAWTRFGRATLLGIDVAERVTLDLDLRVGCGARVAELGQLVIVEVKQWPYRRATPVMEALRTLGARPAWASKYCSAIALADPTVATNELRPGLRVLAKGAA